MSHTNNWDETTPTNTTNATDIDDHIRKVRLDVRERLAVDHNFSSSDDGSDAYGIHDKVTFKDAIASPSLSSNQKVLYPNSGDREGELRYKDKRGVDALISFTGEVRMRMGTTVPAGWLALNGDTIGQTGSGATHADPDFEELFKFLWDELDNTAAPVSGGRGASADADWADTKTLTLPDARARSPICAGTDGVLTTRTIGYTGGIEEFDNAHTHTMAHTHSMGHTHSLSTQNNCPTTGTSMRLSSTPTGSSQANTGGASNSTTTSAGSATQSVMHPWIVITMLIRY